MIISAASYGQNAGDSIVTFIDVVKVDSVKQDALFARARKWLNASFKDLRNVVRVSDKETGEILAKGMIDSKHWYKSMGKEYLVPVSYEFDLSIHVKDNKYKFVFTNFKEQTESLVTYSGPLFISEHYPSKGYRSKDIMDKIWISQPKELAISMQPIIAGLKEFMAKPIDDF